MSPETSDKILLYLDTTIILVHLDISKNGFDISQSKKFFDYFVKFPDNIQYLNFSGNILHEGEVIEETKVKVNNHGKIKNK